jgi:hypothetical protein
MSRTKTLSIAIDKDTNELVGYWAPQSGVGAIVVRADNEKLLERKFHRALRQLDKKEEVLANVRYGDKTRTPQKGKKRVVKNRKKVSA